MLGSAKRKRRARGAAGASWSSAAVMATPTASHAVRVAPLLDDVRNALGDLFHRRTDGLHVLGGFRAVEPPDLGPHRLVEMLHPDLRSLYVEQIFHEQLRGVRVLHALHDSGRRDDQHRAV